MLAYVVFDVWFAASSEEDPAGLVVTVLTAEVQGREPATVPQVEIWLISAKEIHRSAEASPRALVQGSVPMLEY